VEQARKPVIQKLGTGKMPVPQTINFLVEQASCLLLKMVKYIKN